MYAIIAEDGKQYKVEEGLEFALDYRDLHTGDAITFDNVLCVSDENGPKIGLPTLKDAKVTAEVVGFTRGPKLVVQKFRRRKNSRRKTGHRQIYTKVRINKIELG